MPETPQGEITLWLKRWEEGEPGSFDKLAPLVYDQFRAIAEAYMRGEREGHTLEATALVNEVFADLLRLKRVSLRDRAHFFTFAAKLARRTLIDSARRASSAKRGGAAPRVPLNAELQWLRNDRGEPGDGSEVQGEAGTARMVPVDDTLRQPSLFSNSFGACETLGSKSANAVSPARRRPPKQGGSGCEADSSSRQRRRMAIRC